ncbi:MAG: EscU/YscU/HrcU family type III secretion system export apparatus switch protein [Candidatus Methylomirabilales bacterium]
MPFTDHERTEAATSTRREEARRRGQVAKSGELNTAVVLVAVFAALSLAGGGVFRSLLEAIQASVTEVGRLKGPSSDLTSVVLESVWLVAKAGAPFLAMAVAAGITINLVQVGFLVSSDAVTFKWDRIHPGAGLKRLFSGQSVMTLTMSTMKLFVVGSIAYYTIASEFDRLPALVNADPTNLLLSQGRLASKLFLRISMAYLCLALLDYGWQRWSHEKGLRMTRQELKEERKQTEGDPQIKARIRSLRNDIFRHRLKSERGHTSHPPTGGD